METDRLQRLEDWLAIEQLVHSYALGIRRGDTAHCTSLFSADGYLEARVGMPGEPRQAVTTGRFCGREALALHIDETASKAALCPVIHNLMVEVKGDRASGSAVMTAYLLGTDKSIMGEYEDQFVREEGRWLFASRTFTIWREASPAQA